MNFLFSALKEILKNRVYGQHLAVAIPEHLQYHIKNNPTKALTLSLSMEDLAQEKVMSVR